MRHSYQAKYVGVWRDFESALDRYQRELDSLTYCDTLAPPPPQDIVSGYFTIRNPLTLKSIEALLPVATFDGHGYELLEANPVPQFPKFSDRPPPEPEPGFLYKLFVVPRPKPGEPSEDDKKRISERARNLLQREEAKRQDFKAKFKKDVALLDALRAGCVANEPPAIKLLVSMSHLRHWLPEKLRGAFEVDVDLSARVALCTIEIPDFQKLSITKQRTNSRRGEWVEVSNTEKKQAAETILYSLCLRAAYLAARSNEGNWFDTIAVNARQNWIDRATGQPRTGIVASLHATTEELLSLQLDARYLFSILGTIELFRAGTLRKDWKRTQISPLCRGMILSIWCASSTSGNLGIMALR